MISKFLVGRRVKVIAWYDHAELIAAYKGPPEGTIVHVDDVGGGDLDVWVRFDGVEREHAFSPEHLELLPLGSGDGLDDHRGARPARIGARLPHP